jgi:Ca2+-binding RTX toxin-like protein
MGVDTVIEAGNETSILNLAPGVTVSELSGERRGNDLYLHFNGLSDGMMVKDYYLDPGLWRLADMNGNERVLSDVLEEQAAHVAQDPVGAQRDRWLTYVKSVMAADFTAAGAQQSGPSTYVSLTPVMSGSTLYNENSHSFAETWSSGNAAEMYRATDSKNYQYTQLGSATLSLASEDHAGNLVFGDSSLSSGTVGEYLTQILDYSQLDPSGQAYLVGMLSFNLVGSSPPAAGTPWFFAQQSLTGTGALPTGSPVVTVTASKSSTQYNLEHITAGPSNNIINLSNYGGSADVDAGAGDDLVTATGWGSLSWFSDASGQRSAGSFLYGNDGNDRLFGSWYDDILLGGKGADYLYGDQGNDVYFVDPQNHGIDVIDEVSPFGSVLNLSGYPSDARWPGDGGRYSTDTVEFGQGITPDNLLLSQTTYQGRNVLDIRWNENDGIQVLLPISDTWINPNNDGYGVEFFKFADGTILTLGEMLNLVSIVGTDEPEFLSGTVNDDVIYGKGGNDFLVGDSGNDIYSFKKGDGYDQVWDNDATPGNLDVIKFAPGIMPEDVFVSNNPYGTLYLTYNNGADRVAVRNWFNDDAYKVEVVQFSGGTTWDVAELERRVQTLPVTEYGDVLTGTPQNDVIDGLGGDDEIYGKAGDDLLLGGEGADYIEGGEGVDILSGGKGDDDLEDWEGNNVLDAGGGNDYLNADDGANFMAGGKGDDYVDSRGAHNVVCFNAGDGVDTLSLGNVLTLSLGGGVSADSLSLALDGEYVVLDAQGGDSIRFSIYDLARQTAVTLQIIGPDIRTYDFNAVFATFEAAVAQGGSATAWPLAEALASNLISASPDRVIGGDLAYRYAQDGNLTTLAPETIRAALSDPDFGVTSQLVDIGGGQGVIAGGPSNDQLQGTDGPDTLMGGAGNDAVLGGLGNDTYLFNLGDGVDRITDTGDTDTIQFGQGITPDSLTLGVGSLLVRVGGAGDAIHIEGFDPSDALASPVIESFQFADGTVLTYEQLLEKGFDLSGSGMVSGTNLADRIVGSDGADTFVGGAGNDTLVGGAGQDAYILNLGDGNDTLFDSAAPDENNLVVFGDGITRDSLRFEQEAGGLRIRYSAADSVLLADYVPVDNQIASQVKFADGSIERLDVLMNRAPAAAEPLPDQAAMEDMEFYFQVPDMAFDDPDAGDALSYMATSANGSVLPEWLRFDPATHAFSGTPANGDAGEFTVKVIVTDRWGKTAEQVFNLAVANVNDAPIAIAAIDDQLALEATLFTFQLPTEVFADIDQGDSLTYSVTLADGSPLPSWLIFNPATRTFSGTPANEDVGSLGVTVAATDLVGASVSSTFALAIANVNDAPVLVQAVADQATMEDAPFSFTVPADTFTDADFIHGDSLSYSAKMADGSVLPTWLSFDAVSQNFCGTPANADVGTVQVKVIATDTSGLAAESTFRIVVDNVNDIPVAVIPLADRQAARNTDISWQLPAGSFADVDQDDVLSYSAQLADGSALPSWLRFDGATQIFSGHVPKGAKDSMDIQIIASDGHGAQSIASDIFELSFTKEHDGGHGNEGVGNGQDTPPPGHDYNWNDGPGTLPGYPGSQGGRDDGGHSKHGKGRSRDDDNDERTDREDRNKHFSPPYLDPKQLDKHYEDFAGTRKETDTSATLARWIEVDLAVSRQMAMEDKSLPWLHQNHGADIAALHQASAGFLGSKHGFGVDPVSLAAAGPLKTFRGLREGMERIG